MGRGAVALKGGQGTSSINNAAWLLLWLLLMNGVSPMNVFIIEPARQRWLHHHEVRRNIEVARRIERRVTDLGNFPPLRMALDARDIGQDRVMHRVECLRNQRRTDDAVRIARAQRDRSATPAMRHRPGE